MMRSINMIHQLGIPAMMLIFHKGAFSTMAFIFSFQSFKAAIFGPGLANGLTINEVCFFKIPLKSPSMCLSILVNFVDPPTARTDALKKASDKSNS